MSFPRLLVVVAVFAAVALLIAPAPAEPRFSDAEILGTSSSFRIESVRTALTAFWQRGNGFQSRSGAPRGPGSQTLGVFQPQAEVVVRQNERVTHTFWLPIDIVSGASPNAIDRGARPDVITSASQTNKAAAFDWTASYRVDPTNDWFMRAGVHVEEPFRSWNAGLGTRFSFAEDNTVLSLSANEVYDWFDRFDLLGGRHGRVARTTTNGNATIVQLLSPTTVVKASLALTVQQGELGNTWNIVPRDDGVPTLEVLPRWRIRPAAVGALVQWLPWDGALKLHYRYYRDDWGIASHTAEGRLHQRFAPWLYVTGMYRVHDQRGADFFVPRIDARTAPTSTAPLRTADSDLDTFVSQSVGFEARAHYPFGGLRDVELSFGYERYFRSNDLDVNIYLWTTGFRF